MRHADVTLCIPAWQAEPFIARTLECARAQTHAALRILVSVDRGDDATEAICRQHAARDRRIEVIVQRERLGWSANANALLDRVDTPFYFLYFHDDIIEPDYTRLLHDALAEDPVAMSAHCDMGHFGNRLGVEPGHHYDGNACRRLLDFMCGSMQDTALRSLTRTRVLEQGLRFPRIGEDGFWRCHPFLFGLLAAGPALHVPHVLYHRWFRDGSMTSSWNLSARAPLLEGQRASAKLCAALVEAAAVSAPERDWLHYGLYLFVMACTRRHELRLGGGQLVDPEDVWPGFAGMHAAMAPPASLAGQPAELQHWLREAAGRLRALEDQCHAQARASAATVAGRACAPAP
jgi:hypothetical protein